ncbi:hypothetical protein CPB86DRAFT_826887 [Serendipita vermifera]|nr:hypothetical protein CPB86DRAFT_826887 [Serendipita vermifera]
MTAYKADKLYIGVENILISFDIGTTQSAVSFSYVYPGEYPEVRTVIKWPGQPESSGDSKIPTIIAYQNGKAQAFGAEARGYIDDDDYEMASWFKVKSMPGYLMGFHLIVSPKLHLHPETMKTSDLPPSYGNLDKGSQIEIPDLPQNTTLKQIYSDMIGYLYATTKKFFEESLPGGQHIWGRLEPSIVMIFCTPNGWDISQQAFIRQAVIEAGLVGAGDADSRIEFITEGEASVHYALAHTKDARWLEEGRNFAVIDAGGSTVDSTLYQCKNLEPLKLEEACASECVQAGGVFVDRAARRMLEEKLKDSPFNEEEYLREMIGEFEKKTKRLFDGTQSLNVVQFGRSRDNDRAHGIIKGKLNLTAAEVGSTFDETVNRIATSCGKLIGGHKIEHILLVGGFGDSPFLRKRLSESFERVEIVTIDEPSKKAAAEGSVIYYLKRVVTARVFRYTIGGCSGVTYDPSSALHRSRPDLVFKDVDGATTIWMYDPWALKNMPLTKDWAHRERYRPTWAKPPKYIEPYSIPVYVTDRDEVPYWLQDTSGELWPGIRHLCEIEANFDDMASALRKKWGPKGRYWYMVIEVVVSFKGNTIQGRLRWEDKKGNWKEGPMTVIPGAVY